MGPMPGCRRGYLIASISEASTSNIKGLGLSQVQAAAGAAAGAATAAAGSLSTRLEGLEPLRAGGSGPSGGRA